MVDDTVKQSNTPNVINSGFQEKRNSVRYTYWVDSIPDNVSPQYEGPLQKMKIGKETHPDTVETYYKKNQ